MLETELPKKISVFPLSNAIFFPRTVLPLNIFEKRYIQMVDDCMRDQRFFGMIQPKKKGTTQNVYEVGCLGKIVNFNETNDGRFIINLSGIIRFRVKKELNSNKLYRKFEVDYPDKVETFLNKYNNHTRSVDLIKLNINDFQLPNYNNLNISIENDLIIDFINQNINSYIHPEKRNISYRIVAIHT